MQTEDIFYIYEPICNFAKYTGFSSNFITISQNKKCLEYNLRHSIISTIFQAISAVQLAWCYIDFISALSTESPLINLCLATNVFLSHCVYYIFLVMRNVYANDTIAIFTDLDRIEKEVRKFDVKLPYKTLRKLCFIVLLILILLYAYNMLIILKMSFNYRRITYLMVAWCVCEFFVGLSQTILTSNFFFIVLIVRQMLANLNKILKNEIGNFVEEGQQINFRTLMQIHQDVTDVLRRYNKTISPEILLLIGIEAIQIIMQLFTFVQLHSKNGYEILERYGLHMALIFAFGISKLCALAIVSHKCKIEVKFSLF